MFFFAFFLDISATYQYVPGTHYECSPLSENFDQLMEIVLKMTSIRHFDISGQKSAMSIILAIPEKKTISISISTLTQKATSFGASRVVPLVVRTYVCCLFQNAQQIQVSATEVSTCRNNGPFQRTALSNRIAQHLVFARGTILDGNRRTRGTILDGSIKASCTILDREVQTVWAFCF